MATGDIKQSYYGTINYNSLRDSYPPRRATALVEFSKNPAPVMAKYIEGFEYTDPANGESDEVKLTLHNINYKWSRYLPKIKDKMTAKIVCNEWRKEGHKITLDCGAFCVDDFTLSGPELEAEINALSIPEGRAFRSTGRNRTWKNATLKEIASAIAKRYKMSFSYTGPGLKLKKIEQSNESDCAFLKSICDSYAYGMKVYKGKIIIYDRAAYEAKDAVATIKAPRLQEWQYNETLYGTYTGAEIQYTTGDDDKELTCRVGGGNRILYVNEKVDSLSDAQRKACGKVNTENEKAKTLAITIMGDPRIAAGSTVNIEGLRKANGKYFVDKVTHKISAESAYTMDLDMHKVQRRITV